MVLSDHATDYLRRRGQAFREDAYTATNRVHVPIFYNTREDVLARARAEGRDSLVWFGPEWRYAKPWRQSGDFRDWRVMGEQGTITIHHLQDQPMEVRITIRAVAPSGEKLITAGGAAPAAFRPGELGGLVLPPRVLQPGENTIVLRDPRPQGGRVPLFVDTVLVEALPPPASP